MWLRALKAVGKFSKIRSQQQQLLSKVAY
jgi:hypothetical protein